jgi:hypothetical protein
MPRPLRAPPPSGVFYPPGLFGRLALQRPGWWFAHVAQSMQVDPHGFDPSVVPVTRSRYVDHSRVVHTALSTSTLRGSRSITVATPPARPV